MKWFFEKSHKETEIPKNKIWTATKIGNCSKETLNCSLRLNNQSGLTSV